ncbi:MAG: hypothetical protein ACXWKP_19575 [Bradyrhizobium sp.]
MKLFTGWVIVAGLVFAAGSANAQGVTPQDVGRPGHLAVSDISGPYAAMPPEASVPGSGPRLLPSREVYTVLRESGFSPLGIPRLRGFFYTIAVIDRGGDDGRLVIDARNGQIVRFVPAYRLGGHFYDDVATPYAPVGPQPPVRDLNGPRPPLSVPNVASRVPPAIPLPKAAPPRPGDDKPLSEKPLAVPPQQSAAVQAKPADAPATPQATAPVVQARPAAPLIQPTQEMPRAQGLE